ncbi:universal stress protein [Solirubrobacter phytolaccae]|uniref:Universal stress protein n=1 Tax=Solirubrobacter phytolaccae TaxID=1404360 RepID=A0A9X3NFE2_9ACTN|nr:universal stress protein [Solirubrobacter phytolaccae]MDA0183116.1 universal stress protein [Solirubrobacter phytolaccae]
MTRLLIAYDGSSSAKAALTFASALFPAAEAVVAHVHAPPPSPESGALARIALPDEMVREGIERMRIEAQAAGQKAVDEGVELATAAGLDARPELAFAVTPWRELRAQAEAHKVDVIVSGTHGASPFERVMIGSTAASLLHHAERPLLVVPEGTTGADGPILAGYDGSDHAKTALEFAAHHLRSRPLLVAHAWPVPVLVTSLVTPPAPPESELAAAGAAFARDAGLDATATTVDGTRGLWRAMLAAAEERHAAAILVGSRGHGAVASTVLGSFATGLVHAATRPVLVIP